LPRGRIPSVAGWSTVRAAALLLAAAFTTVSPRVPDSVGAGADNAGRRSGERTGAAFGESPDAVAGNAGSYFLLFDADRKPLLGAYWMGDNVIGVIGGSLVAAPTPDSMQIVVIDRYLFPRTAVDAILFWLFRNTYENLPTTYADPIAGTSFTVTGQRLPNTFIKEIPDDERFEVTFTWHAAVTKPVKGGATLTGHPFAASHQFDFERGSLRTEDAVATRVYIPALGFGVSQELWNRIAEVVVGRAVSSADLAFELRLRGDGVSASARTCLSELRATDDYARYQEELAALEQRNETLIEEGLTDIVANGLAPYTALEDRYQIIHRFIACVAL
jgi:hypothetical protein